MYSYVLIKANICTGSRPCPYDSDFRCNDGYCIRSSGVCNRYNNCRDGSDEINCGKYMFIQLDNTYVTGPAKINHVSANYT